MNIPLNEIKRGEVYLADMGTETECRGSEQMGTRPVVVIQNDMGNMFSPVTIVANITSKNKTRLPTHITLINPNMKYKENTVMLEQVRTIDKNRLIRRVCILDAKQMEEMNKAVRISMGVE